MIDIHSHLLHGADDGPGTIEDSIEMVHEAREVGIRTIVATPHFKYLPYNFKSTLENLNELVLRTKNSEVVIKSGFEVFLPPCINYICKYKDILAINQADYMLVEFPPDTIPTHCLQSIYRLQLEGIVPVIAHPERNKAFRKSMELVKSFALKGCLLQLDAASILGGYGKAVQDFCKQLIDCGIVHCIASDAHRRGDYKKLYPEVCRKVIKWAGEEQAEKLFCKNAGSILQI